MSPRRPRATMRVTDLVVAVVCIVCVSAPFLPVVHAAGGGPSSLLETNGVVDQKVVSTGTISNPLNGRFDGNNSGTVDGLVQWDLYTTSNDGMKLVVSSDRTPAMRDSQNDVDVPDYAGSLSSWSVGSGDRRFGFTVLGDLALRGYDSGDKWRGFDGKQSVELARKGGPIGRTRTTLRLRAEFAQALAGDARPTANIRATAVPNL